MHNKLMRSKYTLGNTLYFRSKYGFGITKGTICGLHDDFVRVMIRDSRESGYVVPVKFADVLSIYEQ